MDDASGKSALIAAYAGNMDFVVPFLSAFGSANYANSDGDTLLHAASDGWQHKMIEFLLVSGANPNAQNRNGDTALHTVTRRRDVPYDGVFLSESEPLVARSETFSVLLLRGADTGLLNTQGANPLHVAAWAGDSHAIERLGPSSTIDARTAKGATALMLAVLNGHSFCSEQLMRFGADASLELPSGNRILNAIRETDDPDMTRLAP